MRLVCQVRWALGVLQVLKALPALQDPRVSLGPWEQRESLAQSALQAQRVMPVLRESLALLDPWALQVPQAQRESRVPRESLVLLALLVLLVQGESPGQLVHAVRTVSCVRLAPRRSLIPCLSVLTPRL